MTYRAIFRDENLNETISALLDTYSAADVLGAFTDAAEACEEAQGAQNPEAENPWSPAKVALLQATARVHIAESQTGADGITILGAVELGIEGA
jgi:hypothetical protein